MLYSRFPGVPVRKTAKLFKNGRSQAVRLPSDFRFSSPEVFIRKDPETGDVILSRKPGSWDRSLRPRRRRRNSRGLPRFHAIAVRQKRRLF